MSIATVQDVLDATVLRDARLMKGATFTTQADRWLATPQRAGTPVLPSAALATPTATGSGATTDRATTGALSLPPDPGSGKYIRLVVARQNSKGVNNGDGMLLISDRLVETIFASNVTTEQILDTVALPSRASGGAGVLAALEYYSSLSGGTNPTVTISYTNQDGTSGQTATSAAVGSSWTSPNAGNRMLLPLAPGDSGVRAVHSVTLSSASTTSGNNLGIALLRPIAWAPFLLDAGRDWIDLCLAKVDPQACLQLDTMASTTSLVTGFDLDLVIDG